MGEGESCVEAGRVRVSSELVEEHEVVFTDIEVDVVSYNFINELAEAFNQLDGSV